ncbi:MAG: hypothetical protein WDZ40_00995 [Candidatus Spechtbacterales bacterium]
MLKKLLLITVGALFAIVLKQLVVIFLDTLPVNEEEVKMFAKKIRNMSTEEIIKEAIKNLK